MTFPLPSGKNYDTKGCGNALFKVQNSCGVGVFLAIRNIFIKLAVLNLIIFGFV